MTAADLIRPYLRHLDLARFLGEPTTTLRELRLDAFDLVAIAMDIEDATGAVLLDEHEAWDTVGDVQACLDRCERRVVMGGLIADSVGEIDA